MLTHVITKKGETSFWVNSVPSLMQNPGTSGQLTNLVSGFEKKRSNSASTVLARQRRAGAIFAEYRVCTCHHDIGGMTVLKWCRMPVRQASGDYSTVCRRLLISWFDRSTTDHAARRTVRLDSRDLFCCI